MDSCMGKPGQNRTFLADGVSSLAPLPAPSGPIAPWMRLAHLARYRPPFAATWQPRRLRDWELILTLNGEAGIWWQELSGHTVIPPAHAVLIPPGCVHAFACTGGSHIAVHFDLLAQPDLEPMAMIDTLSLAAIDPGPALPAPRLTCGDLVTRAAVPVRDLAWWRQHLDPLVDAYQQRSHRSFSARLSAAAALTWAIQAQVAAAGQRTASGPLAELLAEIGADPSRPWSLAACRRRLGLGETAFRSAVMTATGLAPRTWIERLRIERASRLLLESKADVAAVAVACGYADAFHFSRVFRRVQGLSPRAWRLGAGAGGA